MKRKLRESALYAMLFLVGLQQLFLGAMVHRTAREQILLGFPLPLPSKDQEASKNLQNDSYHRPNDSKSVKKGKIISTEFHRRYIVFRDITQYGQGFGNKVAGLLAAHLLGIEFNRTVCVSKSYHEFHLAFKSTLPREIIEECQSLEVKYLQSSDNSIDLLNFRGPTDECQLKRMLMKSRNETILYFTGNTYPRWPDIPDNFFHTYYRPTQRLSLTLPWDITNPPSIVVHLRQGDRASDRRAGLDMQTLHTLGQNLPNSTFLVTNRVEWYQLFENDYGWKHPSWSKILHSAGIAFVDWGGKEAHISRVDRTLQTWSDWYTILCAHQVYHTQSDFSASAVHWNNIWGKVIKGSDLIRDGGNQTKSRLQLVDEYWMGYHTPRLIDRSGNDLRGCESSGVEAEWSKNEKEVPL